MPHKETRKKNGSHSVAEAPAARKRNDNWTQLLYCWGTWKFECCTMYIVLWAQYSLQCIHTHPSANFGSCFELNWFTLICNNLHDVTIDGGVDDAVVVVIVCGGHKRRNPLSVQIIRERRLPRRYKGYWHQPLFLSYIILLNTYYRCFAICVRFNVCVFHERINKFKIRNSEHWTEPTD